MDNPRFLSEALTYQQLEAALERGRKTFQQQFGLGSPVSASYSQEDASTLPRFPIAGMQIATFSVGGCLNVPVADLESFRSLFCDGAAEIGRWGLFGMSLDFEATAPHGGGNDRIRGALRDGEAELWYVNEAPFVADMQSKLSRVFELWQLPYEFVPARKFWDIRAKSGEVVGTGTNLGTTPPSGIKHIAPPADPESLWQLMAEPVRSFASGTVEMNWYADTYIKSTPERAQEIWTKVQQSQWPADSYDYVLLSFEIQQLQDLKDLQPLLPDGSSVSAELGTLELPKADEDIELSVVCDAQHFRVKAVPGIPRFLETMQKGLGIRFEVGEEEE